MRPDDIAQLKIPGRPAITPNGEVLVAVATCELDADRYGGSLWQFGAAGGRRLTFGPRDTSPVLSPDGHTLAFLRSPATGPAQLHVIDLNGGEATKLTSHPMSVQHPTFSPSGDRIAYVTAVPETGRYGTDAEVGAEAEAPRLIDRLSYRRDGRGFLLDQPDQIFVLDLSGDRDGEPVAVTREPDLRGVPVWLDQDRLAYVRAARPDLPQAEFAVVAADPGGSEPSPGELLCVLPGNAEQAVAVDGDLYYLGAEFAGIDSSGRTTALWTLPSGAGTPRRMTGCDVEVDGTCRPVRHGDHMLVAVLHRGTVGVRTVALSADRLDLEDLPVVLGGPRVVSAFAAAQGVLAAVVADPSSAGEVITVGLAPDGALAGSERVLTELGAEVRAGGLARQIEITASAPDGYPVHGFLVLPSGEGPHPVLLDVHGGPHAAYGWGLFDEAQVYAGAGYAVVLPNPRGSAGYGHEHGRSVLGRLGTIDADDVLALLDAALARPDLDASRVGVMGGSYGGFMTSWLASHAPDRFTAAISERAVNAWDSFAGSSDIGHYFAEVYAGPTRETQWQASPLAYADDISLPLLIIHSEHDWRCPLEQGQRLYVALKKRGAEVEMLLFPSEGHELSRSGRPRHRLQRFEAILAWWERYLPVERP
ncbi:Dipeptidyl aminopeptidase/acylaminoacyl peptidase [Nakamurella panacisegetis]|uniref:Dipeptidyl aminopeptidase/acylaminoacyl peptidase n=1 Tax=Nakamurella panacisegetis TaxID=1090615 RepID=A0A1H0RQJ9_9ACTN|nr:S9 family peptidase [Nakamurella panacisegetis]SDP31727.1 Dipeptidyl aminopeptidase/acylaminoacyl peptidase [Nakamurella panacisegetis]